MKDEYQSKEHSRDELGELRQKVAELEALETERQQDLETRKKRRKRDALFLTSIPLLLAICLLLLNPNYIGTMIYSCKSRGISNNLCSQPFGWIMVGVFLLLLSASYFITQKTILLEKSTWWVNVLFVIFLLKLPAILIVLLGPASLIILENYYR